MSVDVDLDAVARSLPNTFNGERLLLTVFEGQVVPWIIPLQLVEVGELDRLIELYDKTVQSISSHIGKLHEANETPLPETIASLAVAAFVYSALIEQRTLRQLRKLVAKN